MVNHPNRKLLSFDDLVDHVVHVDRKFKKDGGFLREYGDNWIVSFIVDWKAAGVFLTAYHQHYMCEEHETIIPYKLVVADLIAENAQTPPEEKRLSNSEIQKFALDRACAADSMLDAEITDKSREVVLQILDPYRFMKQDDCDVIDRLRHESNFGRETDAIRDNALAIARSYAAST
jgi:hypothetical protein